MGKFNKTLALLFTGLIALALAGCGGDEAFTTPGTTTDPGTGGGGTTSALVVNLALVDAANGNPATGVSTTNPGQLRATVTYNGSPLSGVKVTFSADLGVLNPSVGTALTDSAGVAKITLEEDGAAGAGTATASVTYAGLTSDDTLDYSVQTTGGSVTPVTLRMGSGTPFVEGVIAIGLDPLSAGATTTATVRIVDDTDAAYTIPVDVSFSSGCVTSGKATIDATVITVNGTAAATYRAQGCVGSDTISATVTIGGTTYNATGSLTVQPAAAGSIEFVSAVPDNITLKGTGGAGRQETSEVTFRVKDEQGNPVQGKSVNFSLNTVVGGIGMDPASATSDTDGLVHTTVQAGTVPTAVRVTASTVSGAVTLESQSDQLVITTGIPDQDSLDIVATVLNPEGWNYSGEIVQITAFLSDRFNNPVPDATVIYFTTEGGSIEGSCLTVNGQCSVNWTSSNPRPCGETLVENKVELDTALGPNVCVDSDPVTANPIVPQPTLAPLGQPYGGRATIVATAVGEESFTDVNGNGKFDEGDLFNDLPEAWRDDDEDGVRDTNEPFQDFNDDKAYNGADGEFNGVLCDRPTSGDCSTTKTLHVRDSLVLVMSGSTGYCSMTPSTITVANGGQGDATIYISDLHNQPMPAGTTIGISVSDGFTLVTSGSFTLPSTNDNHATSFGVTIEGDGSTAGKSGKLTVTTTTPKGLETTCLSSNITESAPPTANVGVTLEANNSTVTVGNTVIFTITVSNAGPDDAVAVATAFEVDTTNFTLTAITAPVDGSCSGTDTVTCNFGDIAAGVSPSPTATITLTAKAAGGLTGHSVTVSASTVDNNAGNDTAGTYVTVNP
jgi:hypothetical protein